MPRTTCGPMSDPAMIPGARPATTGQSTAPCRWCSRADDSAVKMIVAVDVATAMCTTCSAGNAMRVKMIVSIGTIVMPPPMPRRPARKPTTQPSATKPTISRGSMPVTIWLPRAGRSASTRPASTGVIDSRLPRCRMVSVPSAGSARSSAQRDEASLLDQADLDVEPARRGARGLGVVVLAGSVELRRVGKRGLRDFDDAGDAWLRTARVIEERAVADLHVVAHEVARLVVAHAEPGDLAAARRGEVVDRDLVRLGFHQPVAHRDGGEGR